MMERNGVIGLDTAYVNVQYIGLRDSVQIMDDSEGNNGGKKAHSQWERMREKKYSPIVNK